MNKNLEDIFNKAANSNLTPTAVEFIPRSTTFNANVNDLDAKNYLSENRSCESRSGPSYDDSMTSYKHHVRRNWKSKPNETKTEWSNNRNVNKHNVRQSDRNRVDNVELQNVNKDSIYNRSEPGSYHRENDYSCYEQTWSRSNKFTSDFSNFDTKDDDRYYSNRQNNLVSSFSNEKYNRSENTFKNLKPSTYEKNYVEKKFTNEYDRSWRNDHSKNSWDNSKSRGVKMTIDRDESESNSYEAGCYSIHSLVFENDFYKENNLISKSKSNNVTPSQEINETKNGCLCTDDDSVSQRDRLTEQLNKGTLECLICCESVKQREPVWNCSNCYFVLHMWCIIKWARSSKKETASWRCPACQNENVQVPEKYMCFCGKTKLRTEWNRTDTAHSCGEMCGKSRENPTPWFVCEHRCTLLCHPGPCPPCVIQVSRECGCGRTKRSVQCSTKSEIFCGAICDRLLNCGIHRCLKTCHFDECGTCVDKVKVECFCGKKVTEVTCGTKVQKSSCGAKCERMLNCGKHNCSKLCHENSCGPCLRSPDVLNSCACGKTPVTESNRTSCLDPIPTCGQVCGKLLPCGPPNKRHTCEMLCHEGDCGTCPKKTVIKCRCGSLEKTIPCAEVNASKVEFKCQKKCAKKRSCGKHKCNQMCCVDVEHICSQRCTGSLSCGKHRCELLCHRGKCGRCLQSSFEELYCHCGQSVIYPPVPCGTKPPQCNQPCRRQHSCEHPPLHTCHSDRECPPCTVFTDKLCYGGHELRKTIPCYQKEFSCGLPCGAPLPCGYHRCQEPCHPGDCHTANKPCKQPCTRIRDLCGHPCNAPCHTNECPETSCREMVKVTCACGNLTANHYCYQHTNDYRRIISATLSTKMSELQLDSSVNISDINEKITAQTINLRTLECTTECSLIMRNRRLALALQIQNPDLSAKLTPRYSDFMKSWAKKDANLCRHIHDKLTDLVKLTKESKQKSRCFSFEVMNKEKRQLVHEYCAHFGCESEAYDAEPKRNVVAIAVKGRCWLPSYSVLEVVQREMGHRKVPIPIINKKMSTKEDTDFIHLPELFYLYYLVRILLKVESIILATHLPADYLNWMMSNSFRTIEVSVMYNFLFFALLTVLLSFFLFNLKIFIIFIIIVFMKSGKFIK